MTTKQVIVIGGGITGLSTAFYLKSQAKTAGIDVRCTVLEQADRFGGKIQTLRQDGFVLERGPESMLARKPAGMQLVRDLGIEADVVSTQPQNQRTFVARDGRLTPMPTGTNLGVPVRLSSFLKSELISPQGKARALADLMLPPGPNAPDESLGALLRRRFGDELVNRLCEPLLAGIYAGGVDSLSAEATFPQFRQMEREHRSLILAARRSAREAQASAPFNTASAGRSAFITLRGGLSTIIERLYDCLYDWADLCAQSEVTDIQKSGDGYELTVTAEGPQHRRYADAVVVTTPAYAAKALLSGIAPSIGPLLDIPYVSTATVILGYRNEDTFGKVVGSGFVVPRDERVSITACTYLSNKWAHVAPGDYTVIRCYVGRRGQTESLHGSDRELIRLAREAMQTLIGLEAAPVFEKVTRWDDSMPQYQVGHMNRLQQLDRFLVDVLPGVYVAGGGYRGVGIPDCIRQATDAVRSVMAHLTP